MSEKEIFDKFKSYCGTKGRTIEKAKRKRTPKQVDDESNDESNNIEGFAKQNGGNNIASVMTNAKGFDPLSQKMKFVQYTLPRRRAAD